VADLAGGRLAAHLGVLRAALEADAGGLAGVCGAWELRTLAELDVGDRVRGQYLPGPGTAVFGC
jgi:hypothetical protein